MPEKPKNVQIPLELFKNIIEFVDCCDTAGCDPELQKLYNDVISGLTAKQKSIELRDAYAKVVFADGDNQREQAKIAYIEQKKQNKS